MAGISFSGLNSGLDIQSIVSQLMSLERAPLDKLQQSKNLQQKKIDALGGFKSSASSLRSAADKLASSTVAQGRTVTSSDEDILKASVLSSAKAATYSIRVNELATTSKVVSGAVADRFSTDVGAGTFTLKVGDAGSGITTTDLSFGGGSLEDLRSAIQASSAGVNASILHDNAGDRLVVTSKQSGLKGAVEIVSGLTGGDVSLNFSPTVAAKDASVEIDGITVTSSSNRLTSVIEGVTVDLRAKDATKTVELKVEENRDGLKEALNSFIKSYNEIKSAVVAASKSSNTLAQEPILPSLERELRSIVSGLSARGLGRYETLAQIGVKTERDGSLSLNESVLTEAMDTSFDDVASLLRLSGKSSNSAVSTLLVGSAKAGTYGIDITQAATRGEFNSGQAVDDQLGLAQDETLSFSFGTSTASVSLAAGDKIGGIVSKINSSLTAAGIKVTAYDNGGALRLRTNLYGSAQSFTVASNVAAGGGSTGVGTGVSSSTGLDVVGTIGGHAATGSGQTLTGAAGTDVDGLKLRIGATAAGAFGTLQVGGGVMNALSKGIATLVQTGDGTIDSRTTALRNAMKSMDVRIDSMTQRLNRREEILRKQFLKADEALGQLNGQSGNLSNQFSALSNG